MFRMHYRSFCTLNHSTLPPTAIASWLRSIQEFSMVQNMSSETDHLKYLRANILLAFCIYLHYIYPLSFPGVKSGRGVTLTPHPFLVPWSWKSRAIPLLLLWAVGPVQSLSACTRVHFTFTSVPVQGCTLPLPQCLYKGALYLYLSACTGVHFTFTSVPVQGCTLPLPQCLYKGALYLYLYIYIWTKCYFSSPVYF